MEDYIRVYENVISSNWCDALIQKFEDFDDQHEVFDDQRLFTQINFAKNVLWQYESDYLSKILLEQVKKYGNDVRLSNQWPSKYNHKKFKKIKKNSYWCTYKLSEYANEDWFKRWKK